MNGSIAQSDGCETIAPYGSMTDNHAIYQQVHPASEGNEGFM
jgi:hypothetical protein